MNYLAFEFPTALYVGLPILLVLAVLLGYREYRRGEGLARWASSLVLRTLALAAILVLVARPVRIGEQPRDSQRRELCLLVDRSASMSLEEDGATRYEHSLEFAREGLLPEARDADLRVRAYLFAGEAAAADGMQLEAAQPEGKRTNLARAVLLALASASDPPVAVVALTDGVITEPGDNSGALSALLQSRVPFVGVGFGREIAPHSLSLLSLTAPPMVPPRQPFHLSVQIEATGNETGSSFELLLLRDGQLADRKKVSPGLGTRHWQESFEVTESTEGLRSYTVQMLPPAVAGLYCPRTQLATNVRIGKEKDLRVLFVQRSLTWDYKFIRRALDDDPLIKLSGVTQTAEQSILHQTIEGLDAAGGGFPATLEELSQYRVVVLSNFQAAQLSHGQQEMIERFCTELGGGVLVMGGPDTLDAAWNSAPLGRLLPVRLATAAWSQGGGRPFRLRLTPQALSHPVFRITDSTSQETAWSSLPPFTHAAAIEAAKPGAQVWGVHSSRRGEDGRPAILMAQQRFGAGVSAVIGVQTFWRWRLGRDSDPQAFDRFWRQLLRYLAEAGRQEVLIRLPDQILAPGATIRLNVERVVDASANAAGKECIVRVEDPQQKVIAEHSVELLPGGVASVEFRAGDAGMYQISVLSDEQPVATRGVEIRESNLELERPGRDMEMLRQWAGITGGLAVKAEECRDASGLLAKVVELRKAAAADRGTADTTPLGIHWVVMLVLLSLLGTEWTLRKRWDWR